MDTQENTIGATFIYNELEKSITLTEVIDGNPSRETIYKIPNRLSVRQVEFVTKEIASVVTKSSESIRAILNLMQTLFAQKEWSVEAFIHLLLGDEEITTALTAGASEVINYLFDCGFFQRVSAILYIRDGERLTSEIVTSRSELFADAPMSAAVQGLKGFFSLRTNSSNSTQSLLNQMKAKMNTQTEPTIPLTEVNQSDGQTASSGQ